QTIRCAAGLSVARPLSFRLSPAALPVTIGGSIPSVDRRFLEPISAARAARMPSRAHGPARRPINGFVMSSSHSGDSALSGRVALVTGGAVGIGRAAALALARAGAAVGIHYHRSQREAEETAGRVRQSGGRAFLLQADLTDEAQASAV